jgi:hypothetical protein
VVINVIGSCVGRVFFFFQIFVWRYFLSPHAPSVASVRIADSRKLDKQIYYQKRYYVC